MPLLTPTQLEQIRQIIERHHAAYVVNTIGEGQVSPAMLEELKAHGLVEPHIETIRDSYLYGALLATLETPEASRMGFDEFKRYVSRNPIPLTEPEREAIAWAEQNAGQYMRGLGNRVADDIQAPLREVDLQLRERIESEVREAVSENMLRRESIGRLKSDLGWRTGDWARNWSRVARTETQWAIHHGQAATYKRRHGDPDVYRIPNPDACPHCVRLHLGPDKATPIVFKLSELEANGTNVGKKAADWLPIVGPIHPHCACPMARLPAGWGFDEDGDVSPKGEVPYRYGKKLERALRAQDELQKALARPHALVHFQGLRIRIESPKGADRHWRAPDGSQGTTRMLYAYGYIEGTTALDDDELDCYLGPDPDAPLAYIVDQAKPDSGLYDEQKVMLGFTNERSARLAYRAHLDEPDLFEITITPMEMEQFKRWVMGRQHTKVELQKAEPVLYVPLEKAEVKGDAGYVGATKTTRGDRNPGPGIGANYQLGTPEMGEHRPQLIDKEQWLAGRTPADLEDARQRAAYYHDRDGFRIDKPFVKEPHPVGEIAQQVALTPPSEMQAERDRAILQWEHIRDVGPVNRPDATEDRGEVVEFPRLGSRRSE